MSSSSWLLAALSTCFGYVIYRVLSTPKYRAPLPPGPKRLPIIGNAHEIPADSEWLTFAEWGKQYGPICSVSAFGQNIIIINNAEVAIEMLDKKSSLYSDRPVLHMAGELVGWKNMLVLTRYGERFRIMRKFFHHSFGSNASVKQFFPIETAEVHAFLRRVLHNPGDVYEHAYRFTASVILRISHGYTIKGKDDPFLRIAEIANDEFSKASVVGAFFVDLLPALKYVPEWFPGATFKRKAREWREDLNRMVDQAYDYVEQQMADGTAQKCFTTELLKNENLKPEEKALIKWTASTVYAGGLDTSVAAIKAFIVLMTVYPEVQKKAQAEIDAVIGNERLPTVDDRERLPYVNALCRELLRFHTIGPTAAPHVVIEDDIHDGYFIPKGSIVIPNVWQMSHDTKYYTNPMDFDPERFLGRNGRKVERDPYDFCFGFGRRQCPGKLLADAAMFILCSMTLAVYDISKGRLENGEFCEPEHHQLPGRISYPVPLPATIVPRSEKAIALIESVNE